MKYSSNYPLIAYLKSYLINIKDYYEFLLKRVFHQQQINDCYPQPIFLLIAFNNFLAFRFEVLNKNYYLSQYILSLKNKMIKLLVLGIFTYLVMRTISRVFDSIEGLFKCVKVGTAKKQLIVKDQQIKEEIKNQKIEEKIEVAHLEEHQAHKDNHQQEIKPSLADEQVSSSGSIVQLIGIISKNQHKQTEEITHKDNEPQKEQIQEQIKIDQQLNQQRLKDVKLPQATIQNNLSEKNMQSKEVVAEFNLRKKSDDLQSKALKKEGSAKYFCRFNEIQEPMNQSCNLKISQYQQQIESLREKLKNYSEYEVQIEQLRKQVEEYQVQKKLYIDRIQEIIQHVVSQEQNVSQQGKADEDRQMIAINNLKKQINHSYQLEKDRENQLASQLHQNLRRQKQELSKEYEQKLGDLQKLVAKKQKDNESLQAHLSELNLEKQLILQELNIKKEEITKLTSEDKPEQVQSAFLSYQLESKEQEFVLAKQQLQQVRKACQKNESQLFQASSKLFQMEIEKNQLESQLNLKIEELQKENKDLQNQWNKQLEKQFTDEQKRQTQESERQNTLLNKHRIQIAEITKKLQVEQENTKSAVNKCEHIKEELQFCQIQIGLASETQKQLRDQIVTLKAKTTQNSSLKIDLTDSEIQSHPVFLRMKQKYEQSEAQLKNLSPNKSPQKIEQPTSNVEPTSAFIKMTDSQTRKERQPSASFTYNLPREPTTPTESKYKVISRMGSTFSSSSNNPKERNSAIYLGAYDKESSQRYKTPLEKSLQSSILESSNLSSTTFFGQTNILDEKKREFAIGEINRLKKIGSKRTKLLYRLQGKNTKPITDLTSNVPNLFIVIELSNKKIIGAFSQTAFTKQGNIQSQKSKYLAMNKSMIMDISQEKVFPNQTAQQTIRYDPNALIWGRNELVLDCGEPMMLSCNLNCENAIYACQYSTEQLMGDKQTNVAINQCEIFRIFLG